MQIYMKLGEFLRFLLLRTCRRTSLSITECEAWGWVGCIRSELAPLTQTQVHCAWLNLDSGLADGMQMIKEAIILGPRLNNPVTFGKPLNILEPHYPSPVNLPA